MNTVKKGNCEDLTSQHCLEAELKICAQTQSVLPTCSDTALSKMSFFLVIHAL